MLPDSLVQEAPFGITQRSLLELSRDLIPEFLDKTSPLIDWKSSEGLNELLGVHLHVTSDCDGTSGER
jgi:hypothetical protein